MNPTTLFLPSFSMANQVMGAANAEAHPEAAVNIEHFVFFSNIGVFVVTAWLAWVTYMSVRDARRAMNDQAQVDDKQQERLTHALSEALRREQEDNHEVVRVEKRPEVAQHVTPPASAV